MDPTKDEASDALTDLPESLRAPLQAFQKSRSPESLDALVRAALADFAPNPVSQSIDDRMEFVRDLGLDSLAVAEFAFFFEDSLDLKITNAQLAQLKSVGDLKAFLMERLS